MLLLMRHNARQAWSCRVTWTGMLPVLIRLVPRHNCDHDKTTCGLHHVGRGNTSASGDAGAARQVLIDVGFQSVASHNQGIIQPGAPRVTHPPCVCSRQFRPQYQPIPLLCGPEVGTEPGRQQCLTDSLETGADSHHTSLSAQLSACTPPTNPQSLTTTLPYHTHPG